MPPLIVLSALVRSTRIWDVSIWQRSYRRILRSCSRLTITRQRLWNATSKLPIFIQGKTIRALPTNVWLRWRGYWRFPWRSTCGPLRFMRRWLLMLSRITC
eukprot:Rmarinus@m.21928